MAISAYATWRPPVTISNSHGAIEAPKPRIFNSPGSNFPETNLCGNVFRKFGACNLRLQAKSGDTDEDNARVASASDSAPSSSTSVLSFLCPLLKLVSAADPSQERNHTFEVATSSISSLARYPWGSKSLTSNSKNLYINGESRFAPLQLYEFEACPFCRRVREALTELDLSVEFLQARIWSMKRKRLKGVPSPIIRECQYSYVYPCPKGSLRHREAVRRSGGKEQFPFLVDPNTGVSIYESGEIVKYLFSQYGDGKQPSVGLIESTIFTGWMPTILRAGRGMTLWEKASQQPPPQMLQLFSYENNPYARIVREALCELELPYLLRNVGEGSTQSSSLLEASGSLKVPYMIDPNTGRQMGDYKDILAYLFATYCR